jgi:hypothetical protein
MIDFMDYLRLLLWVLSRGFSLFVIIYFILINVVYFVMLVSSLISIVR